MLGKPLTYSFRGKTYEIIEDEINKNNDDPYRGQVIFNDFIHCEKKGDFTTIENRILGGTIWRWLKEV